MRSISGQSLVHIALASLTLLPNFISTQQASYERSYFSSIVQNNCIYILGGSNSTLDVPILNITGGLDVTDPLWSYWPTEKSPQLTPFTRGVAYQGANNQIFVQAGEGSSSELENMVLYMTSTGSFQIATPTGQGPPASYLMTATVNPTSNIVYYYGGSVLTDHEQGTEVDILNTLYQFDTNYQTWKQLTPAYPNATRPGRTAHTSTIVNNQMFIMGGLTYGANSTTQFVEADFESVLVYDINSNTAAAVTTLGDIPPARQSFSTALGLDGRSIVVFGGYLFDGTTNFNPAPTDSVYILDTCTLTWRKQSISGDNPDSLFGHGAININNYMFILMGLSDPATYNVGSYLVDMNQWKWVETLSDTSDSISAGTCQFTLPNVNSTDFVDFNYDYGVLSNSLTSTDSNNKKKAEGFGIGFGLFLVMLISSGVWLYLRRKRRAGANRKLNPRWMRTVSTPNTTNDRDYPLFVYNKELDKDNSNNPNYVRPQYNSQVRTYTASDHEELEHRVVSSTDNIPTNDIWDRMHEINNNEASAATSSQQHTANKILDV